MVIASDVFDQRQDSDEIPTTSVCLVDATWLSTETLQHQQQATPDTSPAGRPLDRSLATEMDAEESAPRRRHHTGDSCLPCDILGPDNITRNQCGGDSPLYGQRRGQEFVFGGTLFFFGGGHS